MAVRALICGVSGLSLTPDEIAFFKEVDPWGLILFRRNCDHPAQIAALVATFREIAGRDDAPVLIDQEGGRVQRLRPPHWPSYAPARSFLNRFANDPFAARDLVRLNARLIAHDLKALGINVDCKPVVDVPVPGAHDIIGDRAYSEKPSEVAVLARAACEGLLAGGVLPVIKHIPGHGRAGADSHEALPVVNVPRAKLVKTDFYPFTTLTDMPLAMTAHVVYSAIDAEHPATTSKKVMRSIVRRHIGYDGLVMCDDLSMQALSGTLGQRTAATFAAGCDMALHCNGRIDEMREVAREVPVLAGKARQRAVSALKRIAHAIEPLDVAAARAHLAGVMEGSKVSSTAFASGHALSV